MVLYLSYIDTIQTNYYEQSFDGATIYKQFTLNSCQFACLSKSNCTSFAFFTDASTVDNIDANTCILLSNLNITNGVTAFKNTSVLFLKSMCQKYL